VGTALNNLAGLYRAQGRLAEAEPLFKRGLTIREKALGPEHPAVGIALNNLAWLALYQRDWARAADYWRRSTGMIQRRALRGLVSAAKSSAKGEVQRLSWHFAGLVKMTHRQRLS
jgi:tetratricopeptide (TPR) repeat protein